jgi:hypothetical protein
MDTVARPRLEVIIGDFKNTMTNVRNALSNYTRSPLPALKRTYDTAFSKYALQLETVGASLRELAFEIKEGDKDAVPFGFALTTNYDKLNNEHGVSSTFGISIADDAMASFVAKAPEQFWQKYKASFYDSGTNLTKSSKKANANVTRIVTFIGNSDIAVKMDGPANFVIKGVRLDADAAFRTSFKVLSQGIKYLTDVAGSPISPASGNSGTPAATIPELANLQKNKGQSESLDLALQNSTDALLRIIAANRADALSPNATRRKNAINAIRNAYTFYKTQLPTQ